MSRFLYTVLLLICLAPGLTAQISFLAYQNIPTGAPPESVLIADFNLDGKNDLAAMTGYSFVLENDRKLLIYYQNEQRTLNAPEIYPAPETFQGNRAMVADDLNHDGRPDIIFTHGDSIGIFYSLVFGGFGPVVNVFSGQYAGDIAKGDLNHDGFTDIAVANGGNFFVTLHYGTPDGSFSTQQMTTPYSDFRNVEIADLNNDQLDDLVFVSAYPTGGLVLYSQQQNGALADPLFLSPTVEQGFPSTPYGIGVGDLNNDGKNDLVTTSPWNTPIANLNLWIQGNNGLAAPSVRQSYDIPEPVVVTDINCDGHDEIVVVHGGWLRMSVYNGLPAGEYSYYVQFDIPNSSHFNAKGLAVGDLNQDGMKDVAIASSNTGIALLYNNGQSSIFNPVSSVTSLADIITTTQKDTSTPVRAVFTRTTTDTIDYVRLVRTDSFLVTENWVETTFYVDSVYLHTRTTCNGALVDTLHGYFFYSSNELSWIDTTLNSTRIDSFFLPRPNLPLTYSLFPNPNRGTLFISFSEALQSAFLSVEIFAADGKRVGFNTNHYEWLSDDLLRLDFLDVAAGFYALRFKSERLSFTEKVVKAEDAH
ncbi:MAG: T9SS type A sorting domain-containing protein [Saprospiraceae bacterium]|nr:T9SS type A sorting domain-containing protein [Saprospiraceae bacterium]